MPVNVQKEERLLKEMTVPMLRLKYAEFYNEETRSCSKVFLIKRILWRMQCLEQGDISERAREYALSIANDADLRLRAPVKLKEEAKALPTPLPPKPRDPRLPMPGSILVRKYKGELIEVSVEIDGFRFKGVLYPSLSAIAKKVTGGHWNGFRFFGMTEGNDAA